MRDAALERDVYTFEAGLETPVGTRGVKLSGGQVQRAAAARMLVRATDLLVIDDLSSALLHLVFLVAILISILKRRQSRI